MSTAPARHGRLLVAAALGAAVMATLALASLAYESRLFFDPCHEWGSGGWVLQGDDADGFEIGPDDDCPRQSATSETRGEAALRLLLVQGSAIVAAALALAGARRRDGRLLGVAGVVFGILIIPLLLGGLWVLPLLAAVLCFAAGVQAWPRPRQKQ